MGIRQWVGFSSLLLAAGFSFFLPACENKNPPVIPLTSVNTPVPCVGVLGHNTVESSVPGSGYIWFDPYVPSANIILTSLSVYCVSATPVTYEAGVYSNLGNLPGGLLSETGPVTLSAAATLWNSSALQHNINLSAGVTYWLALEYNSGNFRFGPATSDYAYRAAGSYGSLPASGSATLSLASGLALSLYGTTCP